MNTKAIGSYFLLFATVAMMAVITPSAYAAEVEVRNAPGSSVPGCEETDECFIPSPANIAIGDTVKWVNDDTAAHTATSGAAGTGGPDGTFDSSLIVSGGEFSYTFDEAGEYPYFCMVHPWMSGMVIVGEAMAEEEPMMSGVNLGLDIVPMLPFDNTVNDMVTLSFTAQSDVLKGESGTVTHLDYKVMISKDGSELWSEQFHDHDGNLELQITPSEGSFSVTPGKDVGSSSTGAAMVSGQSLWTTVTTK